MDGGHFHCGIDVPLATGTPLYAARVGVVAYVGWALLAIRGDTGETDWYVHIDRVAPGIRLGASVGRSELVAYSGNKVPGGGATFGPHLHFEIQDGGGRLNYPGTAVDPVPVLTAGGFHSTGSGSITPTQRRSATMLVKDSEGRVFDYGQGVKFLLPASVAAAAAAAGVPIVTSPKIAVDGVTDDWIDNSVPYGPAKVTATATVDLKPVLDAIAAIPGGGLTTAQAQALDDAKAAALAAKAAAEAIHVPTSGKLELV